VAECVLYVYVYVCASAVMGLSHAHDPLAYHAAFIRRIRTRIRVWLVYVCTCVCEIARQ